ncbi:MAG: GntR family transcriptional [Beijerinckiaceae bacterium]|nr:MAG: GntR family transcriptional [Beijerinckiaceae bacterium]
MQGGIGRKSEAPPGFRPLYRQVKELLIGRIADRTWSPGEGIPSEQQIAADLGVSQGTVRKALDEMTVENLLVRRQGRGTFVARHDEARILFQFFKIVPDGERPVFPESTLREVSRGQANVTEREKLKLGPGEPVIRIARLRSLRGRVTISEYLTMPARLFPGLADEGEVPNKRCGNRQGRCRAGRRCRAARGAGRRAAAGGGPGRDRARRHSGGMALFPLRYCGLRLCERSQVRLIARPSRAERSAARPMRTALRPSASVTSTGPPSSIALRNPTCWK